MSSTSANTNSTGDASNISSSAPNPSNAASPAATSSGTLANIVSRQVASYQSIANDVSVGTTQVTVLNYTFALVRPANILFHSSGRFFPSGGLAQAIVQIIVDGNSVGSAAVIDWQGSLHPAQHSFDTQGAKLLAPGVHTVQLIAQDARAGTSFVLGSSTNLSVFETTASHVQTVSLAQDSAVISPQSNSVPMTNILMLPNAVNGSAVYLLSGRIYSAGLGGDSMLGIATASGVCPSTQNQTWSVNDTYAGAELQSPVFSQAMVEKIANGMPAAFASAFPWNTNTQGIDKVQFRVGSTTTLTSIENPVLLGAGYAQNFQNQSCSTTSYICVGSSSGWPGCPATGTRAIIASAIITIPANHDGVAMFMAKTRIQADGHDAGGSVFLGLTIDGEDIGSQGVQQIVSPAGDSQRTLAASYLADATHALKPGDHTVTVWMMAAGQFIHAAANQESTLIFHD